MTGTSTINLSNQSEGFAITGTAGNNSITGGSGADNINAGIGADTINGFVGSDTVNGGTGTDTIALLATSSTLNSATNAQIVSIEAISAASATAAVTIDLSNQTEGFTITGGTGNDTITGGSGDDSISGGSGADLYNFSQVTNALNGADTITGFATGTDDLGLLASKTSALTLAGGSIAWQVNSSSANNNNPLTLTNFSNYDVWELTFSNSTTNGSVDLGASTDGTELFKQLCSGNISNNAISGLAVGGSNLEAYFVAYDNGNAYLYHGNSGVNNTIAATEIQLIGVLNTISSAALSATDAILN